MYVDRVRIENFRSFIKTQAVALGDINVFIGPNNAGKSSILRALAVLQQPSDFAADLRIGQEQGEILIDLQGIESFKPWSGLEIDHGTLRAVIAKDGELKVSLVNSEGRRSPVRPLSAVEPNHFVVPYLSKRKTGAYAEDVREEFAMAVGPNFTHLAAKLSRLGNPGFPGHRRYFDTCNEILGFTVTAVPSANGQRPGTFLKSGATLPIDQMGEGVPNIVGLLADLALAEGKLFLVEEPENDLHPEALKALLDLLIESASKNQIVVSTHSNIVARHLGSADKSVLYHVDAERGEMPPAATVKKVPATASARIQVLRELGYSFSDFDLWDGWILLEESSAERIIRDYLIPWFAPKLTRVRTVATKGNAEIEPTFADFNRLVRFTHLEEAYRNSAWVLVDGDAAGRGIVDRLRKTYSGWEPDRFECFDREQFEDYYPAAFRKKVVAALRVANKQKRRWAKQELLSEVRAWLDEDEGRGRTALLQSAPAVIEHLRRIEAQLPVP
jgi:ABC-type transport system involved in cytochrome c biogenesis ATPase subunit